MDAMQGVRVGLILLLVLLSAMFSGLTLGLMGLDKNNLKCVPAPAPPPPGRRRGRWRAETNQWRAGRDLGPPPRRSSADGRPTPPNPRTSRPPTLIHPLHTHTG